MKISIVTPSYNQAAYLDETMLSIWSQQGDFDLEHIVADGGSQDGTRAILERYDALYRNGDFPWNCRSFDFTWWSRRDSGQSQALNRGFAISSGEILGWLNSDDTYASVNSLQQVQDAFLKSRTDIVAGNARAIGNDGAETAEHWLVNTLGDPQFQGHLKHLQKNNFILQPACFFRRRVWERHPIDESLHYLMDWDFWLRARDGGFRFLKTNDIYAVCRIHEAAKTVLAGQIKYEEGLQLFRKHDTWCLNRIYYNLYRVLMKLEQRQSIAEPAAHLIAYGKRVRNLLVNRLKWF